MSNSEFYFQLYRCLIGICVLPAIALLLYSIFYLLLRSFPEVFMSKWFHKIFRVSPKVTLIVFFILVLSQQMNEYYFNKFNEVNPNLTVKDVVGDWMSESRSICFNEDGTISIKYPADERESIATYYELKESGFIIIYDKAKKELMRWKIECFRDINRLFDQVDEFDGTPYYGSRYIKIE